MAARMAQLERCSRDAARPIPGSRQSLEERGSVFCGLAIVVATAGLAADLSAEALLAGFTRSTPGNFAVVQAEALLLTGYVGNGLYTVAGILLTIAGRRELPVGVLALGAFVWGAGLWLSAATLLGSSTGEALSTGLLLTSFVVWATLLGRWFGSLAS
jgi:hypothetical protein